MLTQIAIFFLELLANILEFVADNFAVIALVAFLIVVVGLAIYARKQRIAYQKYVAIHGCQNELVKMKDDGFNEEPDYVGDPAYSFLDINLFHDNHR